MFNKINNHNVYRTFVLPRFVWKRLGRGLVILCPLSIIGSVLSGCAIPMPIQAASWVIDGVSYMVSNKSILDHGISEARGQDCAMFRIVTEGAACRDGVAVTVADAVVIEPVNPVEPVVPIEISEIPPPMFSVANDFGSEVH